MAKRTVLFWPAHIAFPRSSTDFGGVNVESSDDFNVADVISPQIDVHKSRYLVRRCRIAVILEALHEGTGAVADAGYSQSHFCHLHAVLYRWGIINLSRRGCNQARDRALQLRGTGERYQPDRWRTGRRQ